MKSSPRRIFFGLWNLDEFASIIGAKLPYRIRYWIALNLITQYKREMPRYAEYHVDSLVKIIEPPRGFAEMLMEEKK